MPEVMVPPPFTLPTMAFTLTAAFWLAMPVLLVTVVMPRMLVKAPLIPPLVQSRLARLTFFDTADATEFCELLALLVCALLLLASASFEFAADWELVGELV
jgi:hypothetical protein